MLAVALTALLLAEFTWSTEGVLSFTQEPASKLYFMKGTDAIFNWTVSTPVGELDSIIWQVYNNTQGKFKTLILEDENGQVQESSSIPPLYKERVKKEGQATLVIKSTIFEDSVLFKCRLQGKTGIADEESIVELVITGPASLQQPVQFSEVGGAVTFTCNATNIPSQNFTWMKQGQMERITSDARHIIVSVTGSSQLITNNISVSDFGYYVCDATVNAKQRNSDNTAFLQVLTELTEQVKDDDPCKKRNYSVAVGEQLSIRCPVSGYPPPIVTWEKNGTLLLTGVNAWLCFDPVKNEDFGKYTCTCTDGKTTIGPLTIRVKPKSAEIPGTSMSGTVAKAAKLEWEHQKNAEFYVVKISGEDIRDDYLVGTQTSLEFHFNALVMKKPGERPKETRVCANVTAMNEAGVVGKTPTCQYITIKSDTET